MSTTNRPPRKTSVIAITQKSNIPHEPSLTALPHDELHAAYERILPEAEALDTRTLARFTLDCSYAYTMAVFALPKLAVLDHDLRTVSHFDVNNYLRYADYAKGTYFVHSQVMASSRSDNTQLLALSTEGINLRGILLSALQSLAARGHIAPSVLDGRGSISGYRALMNDLVAIVAIVRGVWPKVGARTLIEAHEIDRASQIAQELGVLIGQRDTTGEALDVLLSRRQQCAALLIHANRQLRRAVRYLREDEALDGIVPSVFNVGNTKRAKPSVPVAPVA